MWAVPLILWVISLVLNVGPSFSYCTTSVSVQDLGCHLRWSCSDVTSTTFTVQTKIQGAEWENVSHCVQISSYTCDLSQVFEDFDLYKYVRLGLNQEHGKIHWTSSQLCDPVKDPNASFSPPSLSLSLMEQQLRVEVKFPRAPHAVCPVEEEEEEEDEEGDKDDTPTCCRLTYFLSLNTTVTLYNAHDMNDVQSELTPVFSRNLCAKVPDTVKIQACKLPAATQMFLGQLGTHTEMVDGECLLKRQFIDPTPGQTYCAVAHFASSPLSDPKCVKVPPLEIPNLSVLALCGVFVALLILIIIVAFVLRRSWCWCASSDLRLPKSLMSLQSQDQEGSVVDEPIQAAFEEEESIVCLSIVSLNEMLPPEPHSVYLHLRLGDRYYPTAILRDQFCDGGEEADYHSRDFETDGVADCTSTAHFTLPRWSSLPALKTGMVCLLGNFLTSECSRIPLSSVRVAGEQIANMEMDHSVQMLPMVYSDGD